MPLDGSRPLHHMPNQSPPLDQVFRALADPTRRALVERLTEGPASVSELAEPFAMALPSLLQHLRVLENSGLVKSNKVGRVRTCRIEPTALTTAETWIAQQRVLWEGRLDRLDDYLKDLQAREKDHGDTA
jgi:DNA-binding transcriptional ArsR family regulator